MDDVMMGLYDFFEKQHNIRVFSMNGSRVNERVMKDKFQDYDVAFFTNSIETYKRHSNFLNEFGEILILTEPDDDSWLNPNLRFPEGDGYSYLVQYKSGVRIDFQFLSLSLLPKYLEEDSLTKIIGDKDNRVKKVITPSDKDYWQKVPVENEVSYSVREFWWQFNNVLKSNVRGEYLLCHFYLNLVRDELVRLMTWVVSYENGLNKSYGKKNDQIFEFLDKDIISKLQSTFATSSEKSIYKSLKTMGELEIEFLNKLVKITNLSISDDMILLKNVPSTYLISKNESSLEEYFRF